MDQQDVFVKRNQLKQQNICEQDIVKGVRKMSVHLVHGQRKYKWDLAHT